MAAGVRSGLLYFGLIFAFAFAMGVARTVLVAPRIGSTAAVLIEVPILLCASWIVARRLLRHRPLSLAQRGVMGATALALTLASEVALARVIQQQDVAAWAAAVATTPGLLGLAGQLAFAAMPVVAGLGRKDAR